MTGKLGGIFCGFLLAVLLGAGVGQSLEYKGNGAEAQRRPIQEEKIEELLLYEGKGGGQKAERKPAGEALLFFGCGCVALGARRRKNKAGRGNEPGKNQKNAALRILRRGCKAFDLVCFLTGAGCADRFLGMAKCRIQIYENRVEGTAYCPGFKKEHFSIPMDTLAGVVWEGEALVLRKDSGGKVRIYTPDNKKAKALLDNLTGKPGRQEERRAKGGRKQE